VLHPEIQIKIDLTERSFLGISAFPVFAEHESGLSIESAGLTIILTPGLHVNLCDFHQIGLEHPVSFQVDLSTDFEVIMSLGDSGNIESKLKVTVIRVHTISRSLFAFLVDHLGGANIKPQASLFGIFIEGINHYRPGRDHIVSLQANPRWSGVIVARNLVDHT
jgi:hypothetical protein